jgi:hypothetical protein
MIWVGKSVIMQPSATSPLFFDNLHFEHFDKSVNLDSWLTFLSKCYGPQTKIFEGRTNLSECLFEALFNGVSTGFGLRPFEKCFEKSLTKVCSAFENLRLGGVNVQNGDCRKKRGLVADGCHNAMKISRRQLIPIFDKPAFYRISQIC